MARDVVYGLQVIEKQVQETEDDRRGKGKLAGRQGLTPEGLYSSVRTW